MTARKLVAVAALAALAACSFQNKYEKEAQSITEAEAKVGAPIRVTGFVRYALGEGVERPSGDFSGEVAALAGV